jgi:hypothetical protein
MNFVYDDESIEWTNTLLRDLRLLGYDYAVAMILDRIHGLEEAVRDALRRAHTMVRAGRVLDVLRALTETPEVGIDAPLLLRTVNADPKRIHQVGDVLEKALSVIDDEPFRVSMPLNVLAALDVLFLLLIVPQRCLEASLTVVRDTLKMDQLALVDNDGSSLWRSDESRAVENEEEAAFWRLVDGVLFQWEGLSALSPQTGEQPTDAPVVIGRAAAVHREAQQVIGRILSERRAA